MEAVRRSPDVSAIFDFFVVCFVCSRALRRPLRAMMSVPGGISVPPTALAMAMAEAQRLAASVPSAVVVPLTAPAPLSHTPPLATAPPLRPLPLQNATAATPAMASMPTVLPIAPPTAAAAAAAAATTTTPQQPEEGIAPFVTKLFELVNDPSTQSLVRTLGGSLMLVLFLTPFSDFVERRTCKTGVCRVGSRRVLGICASAVLQAQQLLQLCSAA